LESRDHGFMMPQLLGVATSTVAIELMRSTGIPDRTRISASAAVCPNLDIVSGRLPA
jgi:hypothetical protein